MSKGMKIIYDGGMVPVLGIQTDRDSQFYGWLCVKHPDGQWVTLADLKGELSNNASAISGLIEAAEELIANSTPFNPIVEIMKVEEALAALKESG